MGQGSVGYESHDKLHADQAVYLLTRRLWKCMRQCYHLTTFSKLQMKCWGFHCPLPTCLVVLLSNTGDVDFVTTSQNVTFTPGNPLVVAEIIIFEDSILEMDEDFVAHLIITDDTLDGQVTAGNITDVVVTILDDEGKKGFLSGS